MSDTVVVEIVTPQTEEIARVLQELQDADPLLDPCFPKYEPSSEHPKPRSEEELFDIVLSEIISRCLSDLYIPLEQVRAERKLVRYPGYGSVSIHKRKWGDMTVIIPGPKPSVMTRLIHALKLSVACRRRASAIDADYRGRKIRFLIAFGEIVGVYEVTNPDEVILFGNDEEFEPTT